jgi:MoxR-like ATPase
MNASATPAPSSPAGHISAESTATVAQSLCAALRTVIVDQDNAIRLTVAGLLSGGHVLLEGPPGVGKTTLAKALVSACGSGFARVQGTADLLPADITGANIFDQRTGEWVFRPGPLMQHVVLFDEINRATPRAQSALLEAMAERQVSVDGTRHPLPDPFFLIATQNPSGDLGTYPLVAGQRDRFALVATVGRPSRQAERKILTELSADRVATLAAVTSPVELRSAIEGVSACHVDERLVDYLLDIVEAVRTAGASAGITTSLGPRASQTLLAVARALGAIGGRTFVVPDDIKHAAPAVLAHRMMRPGDDRLTTLGEWVAAVTETVRAP